MVKWIAICKLIINKVNGKYTPKLSRNPNQLCVFLVHETHAEGETAINDWTQKKLFQCHLAATWNEPAGKA